VAVYENLVLNPGLIAMPPNEFDHYVVDCVQAQTRVEEFARKSVEVPLELPNLEGVEEGERDGGG
jgi:hypothetical protein